MVCSERVQFALKLVQPILHGVIARSWSGARRAVNERDQPFNPKSVAAMLVTAEVA